MVQVKKYDLPPTALVPNSPYPLLHYPGLLAKKGGNGSCDAAEVYDMFSRNGWQVQWIFRYGPTQQSHYHSEAHECMAVLTGEATIRFGVADTSDDLDESTHGSGKEPGGIEIHAKAGDVFVLPAGTAHKTFDTTPATFTLLTPGDGHGVDAVDPREALREIKLDGFTMLGAYPEGSRWDSALRAVHEGEFKKCWLVPKPSHDPCLGDAVEGLVGLWQSSSVAEKVGDPRSKL